MKLIIILGLIAIAVAESDYFYVANMDMDKLVANIEALSEFTNCLLEKIPCNEVHDTYRDHTLEAVQELCKRCRPHVKHMLWQYLDAIKTKLPNNYIEFRQKYDPENKYFDVLETEMEKYALE